LGSIGKTPKHQEQVMHLSLPVLAVAAVVASGLPSFAATLTIDVEAVVTSGLDAGGTFGETGRDLTGEAALFRITYDPNMGGPGSRTTTPVSDRVTGGLLQGRTSPISRIDVFILDGTISLNPVLFAVLAIGDFGTGPVFQMDARPGRFSSLAIDAQFGPDPDFPVSLDEKWSETFGFGTATASLLGQLSPIQFDVASISTELAPVPLPATGALLAAGISGLACFRRARRKAAA
jgi:hypothetical protein